MAEDGFSRPIGRIMMIEPEASDEVVLVEWGVRLAQVRLRKNLTQAQLAELAGVSKRTVERWESGGGAPQITTLLAVCRVLGLSGRFDGWIPEAEGGGVPEQRARGRGRKRRRAVVAATEPQKSVVPASGLSVPGATSAERRAADFVVVANQID